MSRPSCRLLVPAAILLVAINLRPALASIGPLLDAIQRDTGLTDAGAGLLTTLPVALMGVSLLGTSQLKTLLGERVGVAAGLALILLACLCRWARPGASPLIVTAMLGGVGIAMVQALIPVMIRNWAGAGTASVMGLYSTGIMGGALVSSAASPWIAQGWGWHAALGVWALPAVLGIAAWSAATSAAGSLERTARHGAVYQQSRAWLLLAFFGLGTGAYTLVLAWLPPFYTQLGWSAQEAGALLGAVTLAEVIAGIAVSLWIDRSPDRRPALSTAIGALLMGLLCLCLAPLPLAWPAALLAGLGIGALFPLSLIVAMDHCENAVDAGTIVGFVQGGGYLLAALLPLVAGVLRENLSNLTPAWQLMAALCLVLFFIAVRFRPSDRLSFHS
ncbi:MFS transporter [Methylocystis bryophila]|uniref:MFS transporter n=1 Tax=Methylocystis bryophila TaxID=655015 RepID=A0A1W6N0K3_9HYPH|nr:MFS transporter [Methylocystis bryophila]ARN83329.1 MFS transporter [Methylocystis bryophila]BDV40231.1 MFS transporter [Methylocystis bryophila]